MVKWLLVVGLVFLGATAAGARPAEPVVILIGIDGFRADYLEKFAPRNLGELAAAGVQAGAMTPSFPTLTFPNFYTLATGLRPARHGIIHNSMWDPEFQARFSLGSPAVQDGRWWGGEPIWITAQKQGLRAACLFWPGSEAEIGGLRPWEWWKFDYKVTPEDRVRAVLDWLAKPAAERPRLITLYFHEPDTAGHRFGTESEEVRDAVAQVDSALGTLREGVHRLGLDAVVNYVIVSDHGMTEVSPDRVIVLTDFLDPARVQVDFAGPVAGLRPPDGEVDAWYDALAARQNHFRVYRAQDMPERWHFTGHRRIPPLVLVADEGWMIVRSPLTPPARAAFQKATHGYDNALPSMQAFFAASGPRFRSGTRLETLENTDVYGILCALLGLKPAANDGNPAVIGKVLAPKN